MIENLRQELKTEVKDYLLLKAHIKQQLIDELLKKNSSNPSHFYNPFLRTNQGNKYIRKSCKIYKMLLFIIRTFIAVYFKFISS